MSKQSLLKGSVALLAVAALAGCAAQTGGNASPTATPTITPTATEAGTPTSTTTVTYTNTLYKFTFTLPISWKGFSAINGSWNGYNTNTNKTVQTGSLITLRNPKWTAAKKMQDIPIMVFTIPQWNSLNKEGFTVSAAPIPPSELARNTQFVFALPARYNFAFPAGYQEVEKIMQSKPLKAY